MPNILIFESDLSFAQELQAEFVRRSCAVSIVDDASVGLQQAASSPPDLILLCTELPRMNGFSVCNRLKRDPELKRIPVIIMSANASEENFQQHRNLTNKRADDYVHKPVSVQEMMGRVERLLNFEGTSQNEDRSSLPDLDLKDMEDLDADELIVDEVVDDLMAAQNSMPRVNDVPRNSRPSELELSEFADNAFDALLAPKSEPVAPANVVGRTSERPSSMTPGSVTSSPPTIGGQALNPVIPPAAGVPTTVPPPSSPPPASDSRFGDDGTRQAFVQAQSELAKAKERLADLEDELVRAREKEQTIEKLYTELDDAKARLASGGGGRAKEILDLREALNQKDKELLALRDEISSKDKQLLASKDTALDLERKTADAQDRTVELEKRVASLERSETAAQQDREQAAKRADTYKRKQEKLTEELTSARTELDDLEAHRQSLTAQLSATRQAQEQAEVANRELTTQVTNLSNELNTTTAARDGLQAKLNSTEDALRQTVAARDEHQDRASRAESRINALESEARARTSELEELKKKLAATEQQLDESQLQSAEQGEQLDRFRVAAGELDGLLNDALTKIRELQPK